MKLSTRELGGFVARPDPNRAGVLFYGQDAMRVALKRQDLLANLLGPKAEEDMRLARMTGSELRKDPAGLLDAVKAVGFFPGQRGVFVEDATDATTGAVETALAEWKPGDAVMVLSAGALKATSKLRKLFEKHPNALAAAIYDDPPGRAEIEAELRRAGVGEVDRAAMDDLTALARALDPGDFRQTVEKLGLYKIGDASPLISAEVAAMAPATVEAELDDMLHAVAEAHAGEIGALMTRLGGQGVNPVSICITATRHFRALHTAASHPGGPAAGIATARPPIWGPRRDRMIRQAQNWGARRLEDALALLTDTDLSLRSAGQTAPQMAVVERALIRLSMMSR
ncbi:MAG: DNA polymerase III subunit delta [Celeribacter sp.]